MGRRIEKWLAVEDRFMEDNNMTQNQGHAVADNINMGPYHDTPNQSGDQGGSNQMSLDNLPADVKNALPEEAQHLFIAAYNSVLANNHDREAASRIAWQTIENNEHYVRSEDGKWKRVPDNAGWHTMIHETSP